MAQYAVRRVSDGLYGKGRTRYNTDWVGLQEARLFTRRGDATNAIRHTFGPNGRRGRQFGGSDVDADFDIVEVVVLSKVEFDLLEAAAERDAVLQDAIERHG